MHPGSPCVILAADCGLLLDGAITYAHGVDGAILSCTWEELGRALAGPGMGTRFVAAHSQASVVLRSGLLSRLDDPTVVLVADESAKEERSDR
jgi:hypothetical protein